MPLRAGLLMVACTACCACSDDGDSGEGAAGAGAGAPALAGTTAVAGGGGAGTGGAAGALGAAGVPGAAGVSPGPEGTSPVQHCQEAVGAPLSSLTRTSCAGAELEAMQAAKLGPARAFLYSVDSYTLGDPMVAGSPYAFSVEVTNLDELPIHFELWGAGSDCGTDLERLGAQATLGGVVCAEMRPMQAHTHLIVVMRTNGGYGRGLSAACPQGTCRGTTGTHEEWQGNLEPYCNPDQPAQCEACLMQDGCGAPIYTDHGDGTVSSSCCGLTWAQALSSEEMTYPDAHDYCFLLQLPGDAWRLPTLGEALSLIDPTSASMIDASAFPGATAQDTIWTSTDSRFFEYRETLVFEDGSNVGQSPEYHFKARCVR